MKGRTVVKPVSKLQTAIIFPMLNGCFLTEININKRSVIVSCCKFSNRQIHKKLNAGGEDVALE